jgi:hypothetical protein
MKPLSDSAARTFRLASIKLPYPGRKIAVPRRSGFLGLGGEYDHGFGFDEVAKVTQTSPAHRVEAEVMALALNVVGYHNLNAYQNDLRCSKGKWDRETGVCAHPVAYVSDVGGTLGGAKAYMVKDGERPEMSRHTRGHYITFSQAAVFSHKRSCSLHYPIGGVSQVSEAARKLLADRIDGRIGREQLRIIFEAASIHRADKHLRDLVIKEVELPAGEELDSYSGPTS